MGERLPGGWRTISINRELSTLLRRPAKPPHVNGEVARAAGRKGTPDLFADQCRCDQSATGMGCPIPRQQAAGYFPTHVGKLRLPGSRRGSSINSDLSGKSYGVTTSSVSAARCHLPLKRRLRLLGKAFDGAASRKKTDEVVPCSPPRSTAIRQARSAVPRRSALCAMPPYRKPPEGRSSDRPSGGLHLTFANNIPRRSYPGRTLWISRIQR